MLSRSGFDGLPVQSQQRHFQRLSMHPDLEKLLALQDVDREIARLHEEVAALPRRIAEIETKLAGAKAGVEQSKNAIKANDTARRNLESDIKSHQEKISKYKSQSLDV